MDEAALASLEVGPLSASEELQDEALAQADITRHPVLRPVGTFRMRERVELLAAVQDLGSRFNASADQDAEAGDEQDVDVSRLMVLADIDELLERRCTVHPEEYATWATTDGGGPNVEGRVIALFSKVAEDLGKSMGSAS